MSHWENNAVQFMRLLCEINATQNLDLAILAKSMDLSVEDVEELFDRANTDWEKQKQAVLNQETQKLTIDLNIFDDEGNVVDGTTAEMTLAQISDVVDHAAQLIIVRRSHTRSSGDTDAILDEMEEALVVSGVVQ